MVQNLHGYWRPILGLADWLDESYVCSTLDDSGAEVELVQWEYRRFRVRYGGGLLLLPHERQIWTVVHELVDVVSWPARELTEWLLEDMDEDVARLADIYRKLAERTSTEITNALIRAHGLTDPFSVP